MPGLAAYRYSETKTLTYLQGKVARLSKAHVSELSRTLVRNLAKDGLMEDGKEDLLERELCSNRSNNNMSTSPL